ncbi:MAG: putative sulfate exporter family transporter [Bacteroidetes bacterium]|nr:putative sulfate exporter family transporter [Bacteroidota bacterium]
MKETAVPAKAPERKNILDRSITTREVIFLLAVVFCLSPLISPPVALLLGIVVARFVGHPYMHLNHRATHILLQVSVVGLGFGMQLGSALRMGGEGLFLTAFSITATLAGGLLLGRWLHVDRKTSFLIASGTAICGGSAIAAVSPVIGAKEQQLSVSLGVVFILNAVALFLFPGLGHLLHLSENQFGYWCALAIHDTSSVVGAAGKYGTAALATATTVKLARALWIMPVALLSGLLFRGSGMRMKIPWFIGLFVVAMTLNSCVPVVAQAGPYIVRVAKAGLTLTLFLIGCGLTGKTLRSVGVRPFVQGVVLWLLVSAATLWVVLGMSGS